MSNRQQHPLSAAFPAMSAEVFAELRADIAANGLRIPIILYGEEVLDGWHRHRACADTGVVARYETFVGDDAAARLFVVSANLKRRHLDTSQRAMIAAKFANLPHGGQVIADGKREGTKSSLALTVAKAADLMNVGEMAVKDARTVLAGGSAATIAAVESGEKSVSAAAKEVRAATPRATASSRKPAATAALAPCTVAEWNAMSPELCEAYLTHRTPAAKLNQQNAGEDDNAIDWAK